MVRVSNIQVSEGAVTEPVTLQEIKDYLVIDFVDVVVDAELTRHNKSARQSVEQYLNLALVPKAVTLDAVLTGDTEDIRLPYGKGVSGVTVNSLSDSDAAKVLASGSDYYVRGAGIRIPGSGRYAVSYTTVPGTVPEAIKEAIKMEVENRYNKNEAGLTDAIKEKLNPYVEIWL